MAARTLDSGVFACSSKGGNARSELRSGKACFNGPEQQSIEAVTRHRMDFVVRVCSYRTRHSGRRAHSEDGPDYCASGACQNAPCPSVLKPLLVQYLKGVKVNLQVVFVLPLCLFLSCAFYSSVKTHGPRERTLNPNPLNRPKEQIVRFTAL